jgi:phosphatidylglycerophosphate synthase
MTDTPITLQDRVRGLTGSFMSTLGTTLHRAGVHPDMITIVGLLVVIAAGVVISRGDYQWGGVILLLGLPLDAVDGAVARAMGRKDRRGAVLDSTLDRYADGVIFGALAYTFAVQDLLHYMLLALAALIGSFAVSYVRARAGEADLSVKIGLMDRMVRLVIILTMLLAPVLLEAGLWALALGANLTTMQRLWYVYKHLDRGV